MKLITIMTNKRSDWTDIRVYREAKESFSGSNFLKIGKVTLSLLFQHSHQSNNSFGQQIPVTGSFTKK